MTFSLLSSDLPKARETGIELLGLNRCSEALLGRQHESAIAIHQKRADSIFHIAVRQLVRNRHGLRDVRLGQRARVNRGVVAARDVWMIFVARNQKDSALIAAGDHTFCGNLTAIVNKGRYGQHQAGSGRKESIQVRHLTVFP
jgi:hypothetical protein